MNPAVLYPEGPKGKEPVALMEVEARRFRIKNNTGGL